ncbi:MAG: hypothetical protein JST80_11940 [Bdellovibrionales bacterium]|nr:hypothetical protein [Bdellovibrionales bacterium]
MRHLAVLLVFCLFSSAHAQLSGGSCGYSDPKQAAKILDSIGKVDRRALTGNLCSQSVLNGENYSSTPLAFGARKVLATVYGCAALQSHLLGREDDPFNGKVVHHDLGEYYDPRTFKNITHAQIVAQHPYLKGEVAKCDLANKCKSFSKVVEPTTCDQTQCFFYWHPPLYQRANGAALFYKYARGNPQPGGFDCSASVELAMRASGLLIVPKTEMSRFTTTAFWDYMRIGNSCFKPVSVFDDLKPGDVLNYAGRHMVMVDTVAKDPFNIQPFFTELRSKGIDIESMNGKSTQEKDRFALNQCGALDEPGRKEKFKFTVFQSAPLPSGGGRGSQIGYQNNRGYPGLSNSTIGSNVVEKAKIVCMAEMWKLWGGGELHKKKMKLNVTTTYEKTKKGRIKVTSRNYEPCGPTDKKCVDKYESDYLNESADFMSGKVMQARHRLTPECLETSLKNPSKAKFDPYACADTCNLESTFSERETAI